MGSQSGHLSSFVFDLREDDQQVELLDYRLYQGSNVLVAADRREVARGATFLVHSEGYWGQPATSFYVKWRQRIDQEKTKARQGPGLSVDDVHEQTVSLEHRLPANMEQLTLTFLILGDQVHIFVATEERRGTDAPIVGPHAYRSYIVYEVYPTEHIWPKAKRADPG